MSKRGIIAGGNWIVDRVKIVDCWPEEESLANIVDQTTGSGGAAYNVLMDLAKLGANLMWEGIGAIGSDSDAEYILRDCRDHGISTRQLRKIPNVSTSYTDVMTAQDTGRRTFFHQRGANAHLDVHHFDFFGTRAKLFHLGYLLLLDKLDEPDMQFGTGAAKVLAKARGAGLKTSVDVVSANSDSFGTVVMPALRHVNYCFMNEVEAEKTTGVAVRRDGALDKEQLRAAAQSLIDAGVSDWVFLHAVEGALALSPSGQIHWQGAVQMPPGLVKGAAGAGDAFAAGVLLGLHEDESIPECLRNGVCAAAKCITDPTTTGGMGALADCLQLGDELGYKV